MRKGIILAGGAGTRLFPLTLSVIKQLLPIYDKPMIYYPLSTLLTLGIQEILIISTEKDIPSFEKLFGDGANYGIKIKYKFQKHPNGIAESLILAKDFLNGSPCVLILGDNLFLGPMDAEKYKNELSQKKGAVVFTSEVQDPERYGVLCCNKNGDVLCIKEKPKVFVSNKAITGLYFYDSDAPNIAENLTPSKRGELEITDLNNEYLKKLNLNVCHLEQSTVWLDAGTVESLYESTEIVKALEKRTGKKIGCIEEICYNLGYIDKDQLNKLGLDLKSSDYGKYILKHKI